MRVIAGQKKGIPLQAVPGKNTRPTTDKVKEAIFSLIGPHLLQGGLGLDLYAGTGALGIEALSRGLEKVIFIDHERKAIEIIKQNLQHTGFHEQSEVYKNDALRALKVLAKRALSFQVIFLDPPYHKQNISTELAICADYQLLQPEGIIVVESVKDTDLPENVGDVQLQKHKQYGETEIKVYQRIVHSSSN